MSDTSSHRRTADLMRRAAIASLAVSVLLVGIKAFAYFASHSVAMLASMADSALDLFTSSLNLFAIRSALTPADREHRFGHGKAEPLAGLAQAAFITASALFVAVQAVQRLLSPQPVANSLQALIVMAVSIACAIALIAYQRRVVRQTHSLAVHADAAHYLADLVTNIGVVVAIVLAAGLGWQLADPVIAVLVALVMLYTAVGIGRQSLDQLMDRELPDADRARISRIVLAHDKVKSLHELKTRAAGLTTFIQVHIEMDPDMRLSEAHAISDAVERAILNAYPGAEVIIHQDPAGLEQPLEPAANTIAGTPRYPGP
jgi:ferrous-iron efflux pump FieF